MIKQLYVRRLLMGLVAVTAAAAGLVTAPGTSAVAAVAAVPTVKSVSPGTGATVGGAMVTVTGSGFSHVSKVLFGTVDGSKVHVVSSSKLTVVAPKHAAGTVDVRVVTKTGSTTRESGAKAADHFTYYAPPAVTGVSPAAGALGGGTTVTVTGSGFRNVSKVTFGGIAGTGLKVLSTGKLTVVAPKHAAGTVDVRVAGKYGSSPTMSKDRYVYTRPPAVSGVSPASGPTDGGTSVTITGSGFTGATGVLFGTRKAAGFSVRSNSSVTATAPAGTGTVDVRVVTRGGTSSTVAADRFTYETTPVSGLSWSGLTKVTGNGYGDPTAVGCMTASHCLALDDSGHVMTWNGTTWTAPGLATLGSMGYPAASMSCPTAAFCAAVGWDAFVYSNGTWNETSLGANYEDWQSVSCTSATFCVAVDYSGYVTQYNGTVWSTPAQLDSNGNSDGGLAVSCASASDCVAVDGSGAVFTWNGTGWTTTTANLGDSQGGRAISCPSATFCMTADASGQTYTYNGSAWSGPGTDGIAAGATQAVGCPSATFCMAVGSDGTAAAYNGTAWSGQGQVLEPGGKPSVACTGTTCAATVDTESGAVNTYVSGAWTGKVRIDNGGATEAISCPTTAFCAMVDAAGDAVTEHSGTWGAPAELTDVPIVTVSCTSASFCIAAAADGEAWKYDGTSWASIPAPASGPADSVSVSCASPTFCMGVTSYNGISTYNGSSWSAPESVGKGGWTTVSCASATFCMAGNASGQVDTFNGSSWSAPTTVSTDPVETVTCTAVSFCAEMDTGNDVSVFNGTAWTPTSMNGNAFLTALSCASHTFCVAVDEGGESYVYDGSNWSDAGPTGMGNVELETYKLIELYVTGLSCPVSDYCVAGDGLGHVATGT